MWWFLSFQYIEHEPQKLKKIKIVLLKDNLVIMRNRLVKTKAWH